MDTSLRYTFHLKRVGKPATVLGVKDIMKIHKDVTRFGRHSENDYFLDSAEYLCLVSRWHAELHRVEQEGKIQYMLRDNSLNGTYVNNIRVKGNQVLQENDVVMFGHPNGKNIKPGQPVPPILSEFSFVFEKSSPPMKMNEPCRQSFPSSNTAFTKVNASADFTNNQSSSLPYSIQTIDEGDLNLSGSVSGKLTSNVDPLLSTSGSPVIPQMSNSTFVQSSPSTGLNITQPGISKNFNNNNNLSLANKNNDINNVALNRSVTIDNNRGNSNRLEGLKQLQRSISCQDTPSGDVPAKRTSSGVNRRILSDSDCLGMNSGSEGTMLVLKDISNASLKKAPGLVHLDQLFKSHGTLSPGRIKPPLSKAKKSESDDAAKHASSFRASADSDEDLLDSFKPLNPAISTIFSSSKATTPVASEMDSAMTTTGSTCDQQQLTLLQNPSQSSIIAANYKVECRSRNMADIKPSSLDVVSVTNSSSPLLSKNPSSPVFQTVNIKDVSDQQFIPISDAITPKSNRRAVTSSPYTSKASPSLHYDQSSSRSGTSTPSQGVKRPHSTTPSREDTPTGSKKKRRKGKRWTQVKKRLTAGTEEDEKYHYDGDPCDSMDCYRPAGNKVSWVQCDDCDAWYHTVCAGTTFDVVNDDNTEFHCGCL